MAKKTPKRIELNTEILDRFFRDIYQGDVAGVAAETGLSYGTIYNLVHGRFPALKAKYELLAGNRSARARALGMKQH